METATARPKRQIKWSRVVLSWYGILLVYLGILGLYFLIKAIDGDNGNNPIALKLGGLTFRWYGIIITGGVIIASFLAQFLAERRRDDPDHVWRILPILLVSAILMARVWYVVFTWESYKNYLFSINDPNHAGAIEIWRGGIAIQGAVVGGLLGALVYGYFYNRRLRQNRTRFKNPFSLPRFADFVAPGLVLAQGIGRWGNFMNNEAYGRETKWPWGVKIPCDYRTSGTTPGTVDTRCIVPSANGTLQPNISKDALFHPTFLYESLWDYFTFLVLFFCIMKPKTVEQRFKVKLRDGDIFLLYAVIYSIGRFFTEGLRTDSLYLNGSTDGIRSAQLTAIIEILIAGFVLFYRHRKAFPLTQAISVKLPALAMASVPVAVTTSETFSETTSPVAEVTSAELDEESDLEESPLPEAEIPARPKPDYKARVKPLAATAEDEAEAETDPELDTPEQALAGEVTETTGADHTVATLEPAENGESVESVEGQPESDHHSPELIEPVNGESEVTFEPDKTETIDPKSGEK